MTIPDTQKDPKGNFRRSVVAFGLLINETIQLRINCSLLDVFLSGLAAWPTICDTQMI